MLVVVTVPLGPSSVPIVEVWYACGLCTKTVPTVLTELAVMVVVCGAVAVFPRSVVVVSVTYR